MNQFFDRVNNIYKDFTQDPNDLPRKFKFLLDRIGDEKIYKLTIFRKPLQSLLYGVFNVFTLGEFQNRFKRSNYDDLFHLGLLINDKYILEKTKVINLMLNDSKYLNANGVEYLEINNIPQSTIKEFVMNAYNVIGNSFLLYNPMNNNCQIFIKNILTSNNLYNDIYNNFIIQNVMDIFKNNTFLQNTMNSVTSMANRGTYAFGGSIVNNTLSTTSNDELYKISNTLDLKIKVLMSDEILNYIPKGLPDGNYILNLENSNQNGSHWTGLVKKANVLYYNDSYGSYPDAPVYDLIKTYNYSLIMNERSHQKIGSSSCGYWVIFYLYFMNIKNKKPLLQKFKSFNNLFSNDANKNEKLLFIEIKKLLYKSKK